LSGLDDSHHNPQGSRPTRKKKSNKFRPSKLSIDHVVSINSLKTLVGSIRGATPMIFKNKTIQALFDGGASISLAKTAEWRALGMPKLTTGPQVCNLQSVQGVLISY
jgi:hypothetical protein